MNTEVRFHHATEYGMHSTLLAKQKSSPTHDFKMYLNYPYYREVKKTFQNTGTFDHTKSLTRKIYELIFWLTRWHLVMMASKTAPLSTPSKWISSMITSATSFTYWRDSQLLVTPSHFSGVVITIFAAFKLPMSGVWSPVNSTVLKSPVRFSESMFQKNTKTEMKTNCSKHGHERFFLEIRYAKQMHSAKLKVLWAVENRTIC